MAARCRCRFSSSTAPHGKGLSRPFPARSLARELEDVGSGSVPRTVVCFLQSLKVGSGHVDKVIEAAHIIPLLVGVGAKFIKMIIVNELFDDVEFTRPSGSAAFPSGNKINIQVWPFDINTEKRFRTLT